jgi:hypothetical protein
LDFCEFLDKVTFNLKSLKEIKEEFLNKTITVDYIDSEYYSRGCRFYYDDKEILSIRGSVTFSRPKTKE